MEVKKTKQDETASTTEEESVVGHFQKRLHGAASGRVSGSQRSVAGERHSGIIYPVPHFRLRVTQPNNKLRGPEARGYIDWAVKNNILMFRTTAIIYKSERLETTQIYRDKGLTR